MINLVEYKRTVSSCAMSKYPNQNGLYISNSYDNNITLEARNPKTSNKTTYLWLSIPKENIQEVIDKLKTFI